MNREILRISIPSIVTNITVPLLGMVDVAIVGHIGNASYIAAIALATMVFNLIYWNFGFLRAGTTGLTAQAYGAENKEEYLNVLVPAEDKEVRFAFSNLVETETECKAQVVIADETQVYTKMSLTFSYEAL